MLNRVIGRGINEEHICGNYAIIMPMIQQGEPDE
jgi:hypothetical protein